jgi:hypothetical protein
MSTGKESLRKRWLPRVNRPVTLALQIVLGLLVVLFLVSGQPVRAAAAAAAVVFSLLPAIVQRNYKVTVPWFFEFIIAFLLFLHLIGLYFEFYTLFWWWDKMAHFAGSAVIASLGFYGVLSMQMAGKIHVNVRMMALFAFVFAVAIGAVWEIGEYGSDVLLGTRNQAGNTDTMVDLINDTIAAAIVAIAGSIYARKYACDHPVVIDIVKRNGNARV